MAKVQLEAILKLVDVQINPQVFRKISQSIAGMPANLNLTVKGLQNAGVAAGGLNRQLKNTTNTLSANEKAARLFLQRMAQFAILLPTFATLNRAIQGGVKFLFEFDSALRDIVRTDVKGLSGRMEAIGDAALKTAVDFGVLGQEVLNTVKIFVQAGLSIEDAQARSQLAIKATQVSTLSSADAIEFFISASQQFQLSTEGLTNALDALVKTEDIAAVEAQDIAEAFRTGGNSFAEFTKDVNASIAIITGLREQTRKSGREIGTFFKTFATRAFAAGEARDAIESLGVSVANLDGSFRPALAVINDLKKAFSGLTEEQQANTGKVIAGVRQYETFLALLNSTARINEVLAEANKSAGAADLKRTITDQKLSVQLGKLIAQGQAFAEALGDAGLEDALRGVLQVATSILAIFTDITKAIDSFGGNLAPLLALGGITLGKAVFGFGKGVAGGGGVAGGVTGAGQAVTAGTGGISGGAAVLSGLIGTILIPKMFDPLVKSSNEAVSAFGKTAETSLSLGATFLASGNIFAAAAALAAGALGSLASQAIEAFKENEKAKQQQKELEAARGRVTAGKALFTGGSDLQNAFQKQFLDLLKNNVSNLGRGPGIQKTFEQAAGTKEATAAGIKSAEDLRNAFFSSIDVQKKFVDNQQDYIASLNEAAGRTGEVENLNNLLADTANTLGNDMGPALSQLEDTIGATGAAAGSADAAIKRAALSLEEIGKVREVQRLGEEFRTLSLQLDLAKEGPQAVADTVTRMSNEILIAERALRGQRFDQQISDITSRLTPNGGDIKLKSGDMITANQFIVKFFDSLNSVDTQKVAQFNQLMMDIPDSLQGTAKELTDVLKDQASAELDLQKQKNDREEEIRNRAKKLLEEEQKASIAAFDATASFNAELQKFGDAVSGDILEKFQNVSLGDVKDVLAGKSDLSAGLQQIIQSAFGEDKGASRITKAQTELRAVSAKTEAELAVLAQKLDLVNGKLADQSNSNEIAALTGEKLAIQTEIEKTKQDGAVDATQAKIKVLEAERKAADEAAEKEKKHKELLDKLAEATRDFNNELRDAKRGFNEFAKEARKDLLDKEADAQSNLKEKEQDVLDTTKKLSDSYDALIKAQLEFNGVIAEAKVKANLLGRDIALLTGGISSFNGQLNAISEAFNSVLSNSNISLAKRIELERQLADETLSFLQQAKDQIVQAGLGVFGQTSAENQQMGQGIAGLQFIAEQLGGSFESFLNLTKGQLSNVTDALLSLPADFRKNILDVLSSLPSTVSIGGFTVDQLTQAIGQVGAGVAPEAGLPSIEELTGQQVEQLKRLQELALQDAQLQVSQVLSAQKELEAAQEAADAAKLLQERATEELEKVRDAVLEESSILDLASQKQQELLAGVIAADDRNTLQQIEKEAQLFADQNVEFAKIGDNIVKGIASVINARLATIEAAQNVANQAGGYIPNFSSGNLSPGEAAGLLRAASREKKAMPAGAGLAVANTSEAIIPMHHRGFIPNFQAGNLDSIAAGVSSIKQINETTVAAIAQSVGNALSNLNTGNDSTEEQLTEVITQLRTLNDTLNNVNDSNAAIQSNTSETSQGGTATAATQEVRIRLETNQNTSVNVTGLSTLRDEIAAAVKNAASDQVDTQLDSLLKEFDGVITALQERGLLSSLGQPR